MGSGCLCWDYCFATCLWISWLNKKKRRPLTREAAITHKSDFFTKIPCCFYLQWSRQGKQLASSAAVKCCFSGAVEKKRSWTYKMITILQMWYCKSWLQRGFPSLLLLTTPPTFRVLFRCYGKESQIQLRLRLCHGKASSVIVSQREVKVSHYMHTYTSTANCN